MVSEQATTGTVADQAPAVAALLWEACNAAPDGGRLEAALERADAAWAVSLAATHRISGLLHHGLASAGLLGRMDDDAAILTTLADVQAMAETLLLPRAIGLAMPPLLAAGLEPVVLKGAALLDRYPATGTRPMEDVDLLLPRSQHTTAVHALQAAGWQVVRRPAADRYDTTLSHAEVPTLPLELHYGLESWYERYTGIDAETLWRSRRPVECLGHQAFALPVEEEIVLLAQHAGKPFHRFARLIWMADLAMVVAGAERTGGVDWDRLAGLAVQQGCRTVVGTALAMAERAGVSAPLELFELPTKGWRAGAVGDLRDPLRPVRSDVPSFHLRFSLCDRPWRRAVLAVGALHGMPWGRRLIWPVRAAGQAARRWGQLHGAAPSRPGCESGRLGGRRIGKRRDTDGSRAEGGV